MNFPQIANTGYSFALIYLLIGSGLALLGWSLFRSDIGTIPIRLGGAAACAGTSAWLITTGAYFLAGTDAGDDGPLNAMIEFLALWPFFAAKVVFGLSQWRIRPIEAYMITLGGWILLFGLLSFMAYRTVLRREKSTSAKIRKNE